MKEFGVTLTPSSCGTYAIGTEAGVTVYRQEGRHGLALELQTARGCHAIKLYGCGPTRADAVAQMFAELERREAEVVELRRVLEAYR